MTWFMAIPEEGTYDEMKRKLLALAWGWDLEPQQPPALAEVWPHLFCAPDWQPSPSWPAQARTFEQMRQYAMLAGKAIVFRDGTLYDAERHALRTAPATDVLHWLRANDT